MKAFSFQVQTSTGPSEQCMRQTFMRRFVNEPWRGTKSKAFYDHVNWIFACSSLTAHAIRYFLYSIINSCQVYSDLQSARGGGWSGRRWQLVMLLVALIDTFARPSSSSSIGTRPSVLMCYECTMNQSLHDVLVGYRSQMGTSVMTSVDSANPNHGFDNVYQKAMIVNGGQYRWPCLRLAKTTTQERRTPNDCKLHVSGYASRVLQHVSIVLVEEHCATPSARHNEIDLYYHSISNTRQQATVAGMPSYFPISLWGIGVLGYLPQAHALKPGVETYS
ncbi:hypothetical protein K491DRAFT_86033 [Lophiostoma macrostomum CBS 122681]|uniref:Uncharacterized protein n=1 Tax=Lophiostoma macrostomum CBS 122681 TaxID=1314788 RepID=A0A6A6SZE1_9PLEO|nr:hypothetical protein K491DRAFT_86033 [Lophiostoma macrostomum CBS 122681]